MCAKDVPKKCEGGRSWVSPDVKLFEYHRHLPTFTKDQCGIVVSALDTYGSTPGVTGLIPTAYGKQLITFFSVRN